MAETYCGECKNLFDLDISFPLNANLEGGPQVAHHKSYSALCQAARVGCKFCQLIVENTRGGKEETLSTVLPDAKWQVYIQIFHDTMRINIPRRIGPSEPGGNESIEADEIGEDNITLYISTEHNDPLAPLFSMRPLSKDSSSDGCFEIASQWLQNCLDTHEECPKQLSALPSRVIDVSGDGKDPFLYISKGECSPWIALSHCWGLKQNFITTLSTFDIFSQKIPINELPETFKDAILITRRLGYKYIWIDSLCIIQDSQEDWEAESQKMGHYYQNAATTISADAADGDYQGIFKGVQSQRDTFRLLSLPFNSAKRKLKGNIFISIRQGRHDFKAMPLQTRAWVLQEKVLSVRNLHYQNTGLVWHCQTHTSTETRPTMAQRHLEVRQVHKIPRKSLPARIDFEGDIKYKLFGDAATLAWWYFQVNDYTKRKLTFKKDRFPAISGLAREFADRTGYHYIAGIWAEDFRRGLLWRGEVAELFSDLCPSWSWAGAAYNSNYGKVYDDARLMKHCGNFAAELISFSDPKPTDVFLGGGAATILNLRGWCKGIQEFMEGQQFHRFSLSSNFIWEPPGPIMLHLRSTPFSSGSREGDTVLFWPDQKYNNDDAAVILAEKKVVVLRISDFESQYPGASAQLSTYGILLEPIGRFDDTYRRIGLVGIPSGNKNASIEGFDLRTIRIV